MMNRKVMRSKEAVRLAIMAASMMSIASGGQAGAAPRQARAAHGRVTLNRSDVTVVPCSGATYRAGGNPRADSDGDMDKRPHPHEEQSVVFLNHIRPYTSNPDQRSAERSAINDFHNGFFSGTRLENTNDDNKLYDHFIGGDGSDFPMFPRDSKIAADIAGSPDFAPLENRFTQAIVDQLNKAHSLCGFNGNAILAQFRYGYFHSPLFLWAVMGGYHGVDAKVTIEPGEAYIDITYVFYDHFGAGVSDANSWLPGLSGLYFLQHYRASANGYRRFNPFLWKVEVFRRSRFRACPAGAICAGPNGPHAPPHT